jgi:replicative DNA helicase
MGHLELELISNIIKTQDFSLVKKKGITPTFFRTDEGRAVFDWLWGQYHNPNQRGEVPDAKRLIRHFPDFEYSPSKNSIAAVLAELQEKYLLFDIERVMEETSELVHNSTVTPTLILQQQMAKLRELSVTSTDDEGLLLANGHDVLKTEYETKMNSGGITGIPYPWEPLNRATGGMHPEQLIILYARPKSMKTFVAIYLASFAYTFANARVFVFSKEMTKTDMLRRTAGFLAGVDYTQLKEAKLPKEDYQRFLDTLAQVRDLEAESTTGRKRSLLFASDKGQRQASTVDDVVARAERFDPDFVIIDGLYLMRDGRSGQRSVDWKQISNISQDIKGMAQYLGVPVLGTTQANRVSSKVVSNDMDDLSYADSLGQDADLVMRLFKGPHPTLPGKASIAINFPGVREADLRPFLINAIPCTDFSLLQNSVDMRAFLKTMEVSDRSAEGAPAPKPAKREPAKKTPGSMFRS